MTDPTSQITGILLGTAVGDAIGLPREGLSRRRSQKLFGGAPLRHRLIGQWGMTSDDTEHTCMTAQALLASHGQPHCLLDAETRGKVVGRHRFSTSS